MTNYKDYIEKAKELGMKALAFSEHGCILEWYHKKSAIEDAGMKYIHAVEAYVTETLDEKVRDNYHCVLIAKNYEGFLELNRLTSRSFNRNDNHFYYAPRISFDELFATSNNILITTACIAGVLGKAEMPVRERFINFLIHNKDRCFLEIQHHLDPKQVEYNKYMLQLHERYGLKLIAGTDTHALDERHEKGRSILQISKNIRFEGEDLWDLKFKSFEQLVAAFKQQNALPENVYMEAIDMTNTMADMIEPFELDKHTKYPHIYNNPEETFRSQVYEAMENHPYALQNHTREELTEVVERELDVYKATQSIDFMLLQTYLRQWEKEHGIQCGYGRGSVSGSMVAYLLGITQMDSMRFGLNFFRFMNPSRVTNADIDSDYSGKDRDAVKEFILKDKLNLPTIRSAEIVTFNTIATKGAVRDVCRALYKESDTVNYIELSNEISKAVDSDEEKARAKYPDVFEYVDLVTGTVVSIGTHPSGVLISDRDIEADIGLCSVSTSDYPVTVLNMKELDELMYVKLDILGLDNIGIINDTCKMLGIDRLTPDNVDMEDEKVWQSIAKDTTLVFQWESNSSAQFLKRFMSERTLNIVKQRISNFSMIKWLSLGNGLIRPACASFRDAVANGEFYDNGFQELNDFLAPEAGRIAMQETIMRFLVNFCGYSDAESDTVRRAIAKKKGTETLLPEIERRFIEYSSQHYDITEERCAEVIKPFLQIILDASAYGFSWNHSDAYSCIGYISGYLRYYYPFEFITAALNIFNDNQDKTADITRYASKQGIKITPPKWGISRGKYFYDKDRKIIAKDLTSVKYMSQAVADQLYELSKQKTYTRFIDLLADLENGTIINTRQIDILIKIDFFSDFGNQRELLRIAEMFYGIFKRGQVKQIKKDAIANSPIREIVEKYAVGTTKHGDDAKSYTLLDVDSIMRETEDAVKGLHMSDLDDTIKIQNFYDVMGYVGYASGNDEDRKKLYVMDVIPLHRKKDGKQFGYSVITHSIGSGKESRFTLFNRIFDKKRIQKGSLIYCTGYERDGKYFTLTNYDIIA